MWGPFLCIPLFIIWEFSFGFCPLLGTAGLKEHLQHLLGPWNKTVLLTQIP